MERFVWLVVAESYNHEGNRIEVVFDGHTFVPFKIQDSFSFDSKKEALAFYESHKLRIESLFIYGELVKSSVAVKPFKL